MSHLAYANEDIIVLNGKLTHLLVGSPRQKQALRRWAQEVRGLGLPLTLWGQLARGPTSIHPSTHP